MPLKHAGAKPSNSYYLRYSLPRFNLLFELNPGSCKLHIYNYSEYYIASQEAMSQALKSVRPQLPHITQLPLQLEEFIVLVADDPSLPVKVLVPDAQASFVREMAVSGDFQSAFFASRSVATSIDHHCYTFHPYTTQLDRLAMESRLYLAALHAACCCAVPLAGLGMTGGEHALQLLRQG